MAIWNCPRFRSSLSYTPVVILSVLIVIVHIDFGLCFRFFLDWKLLHNAFSSGARSYRQATNADFLSSPVNMESPLKPLEETEERLTKKCFGDIGCVENTEEWYHIIHRPFNLLPFDREVVNTRFFLYTRQSSTNESSVKPKIIKASKSSLLEAGFDKSKPIKFIIHGFIDHGSVSWVVKMAKLLIEHHDYNVIAVDWGKGALPLYTQATANARLVGLEVAYLINFMKKKMDVDPANVHIIGHSLGSHIAGYAGERVEGLGRITALDPAEPYFQMMPKTVRLDPSDANFVDTIHTDGRTILMLGYGMSMPCGHIDFYPNDGEQQPGCELADAPTNLLLANKKDLTPFEAAQREVIACNHNRAIYYFIESIKNECQVVAHACNNFQDYLQGNCYSCGEDGSLCAIMGLHADKYSNVGNYSLVKFYVTTTKNPPYCIYHYRVNLRLAFPIIAENWVSGKLKITIEGANHTLKNVDLDPVGNLRLDHGKNVTFVLQSPMKLGLVNKVKLDWQYTYNYYDLLSTCWAFLCNQKLFVKNVEVYDMDSAQTNQARSQLLSQTFCGEEGTTYTGIKSESSATFERKC